MPPALYKVETAFFKSLPDSLVRRTFGMPECLWLRAFHAEFRKHDLIRIATFANAESQIEVGAEVVGHGVTVIIVVRHDKILDVGHYLMRTVCQSLLSFYPIMIDGTVYISGLFCKASKSALMRVT